MFSKIVLLSTFDVLVPILEGVLVKNFENPFDNFEKNEIFPVKLAVILDVEACYFS